MQRFSTYFAGSSAIKKLGLIFNAAFLIDVLFHGLFSSSGYFATGRYFAKSVTGVSTSSDCIGYFINKNNINFLINRIMKVKTFLLVLALAVVGAVSANATVRYVRTGGKSAANAASATSWMAACSDLQAVINASDKGDTIWVYAGTYKPNSIVSTDGSANPTAISKRDYAFVLKQGVKIYGGFAGETDIAHRDLANNVSILSGSNCSYHVVIGAGIANDGTTVLDGFTITGGNATNSTSRRNYSRNYGGTFYGNTINYIITVNGQSIDPRCGGGIYNKVSSPMLANVIVSENSAENCGGGIYNRGSSPMLANVIVSENMAYYGGGIYNNVSSPTLTHVTVSGNAQLYRDRDKHLVRYTE